MYHRRPRGFQRTVHRTGALVLALALGGCAGGPTPGPAVEVEVAGRLDAKGPVGVAPPRNGRTVEVEASALRALGEEFMSLLAVEIPGAEIEGPAVIGARLDATASNAVRRLVRAASRGERIAPAEWRTATAAAGVAGLFVLWFDETTTIGREQRREDVDSDLLDGRESAATFEEVNGRAQARLIDAATGRVVWAGRRDYSTGHRYEAIALADELARARLAAVTDLAVALAEGGVIGH